MLRVYGLWISEKAVLLSDELYSEKRILKFPGGGLEYGEGLLDGLHREWKEETGLVPLDAQHFYTTDFFQESAFHPGIQLISVYYSFRKVAGNVPQFMATNGQHGHAKERFFWQTLEVMEPKAFTFPIDRHVAELLKKNEL